jgi:hypothetical protein
MTSLDWKVRMDQEEASKKPITLTRDALYNQVWQTPMSRLAGEYGISGNGLAKICDRLNVPCPPRGYWAKKVAGKKVVTYRLPDASEKTPLNVTIYPTLPANDPDTPAEVKEAVEIVRSSASEIKLTERLTRPHEIIARWLAERERRKQEARRERDPWRKRLYDPGEWTPTDRRKHLILDALFKALEKQGAWIKQAERQALSVELQGEKIEIQLREKHNRIRRPPTDEEKKNRLYRDGSLVSELQPSGNLVFSIKTYLPAGLHQEWVEGERKRMEDMLPDILATLIAAGPLLVEQRRKREEAERQRQIAEQRRYEEQQRRKRDNNRWRRFVDIAQDWRNLELARAFLTAVKQSEMDREEEIGGRKLGEWLSWAEDRISTSDPINAGAEAIFGSVAAVTEWTYRD